MNPPERWVAVAGVAVLSLIAAGGLAIAIYTAWLFHDMPDAGDLVDYRPPTATRAYAWDGTLIGEFSRERRICRSEKAVRPPPAMAKPATPGTRNSGTAMRKGRPRMPAMARPIQPPAARSDRSGRSVAENSGLVVVLVCIGMMDSP